MSNYDFKRERPRTMDPSVRRKMHGKILPMEAERPGFFRRLFGQAS